MKRIIGPALPTLILLLAMGGSESGIETEGPRDQRQVDWNEGERIRIYDTHVHYKEPAWSLYSPTEIIELMERAGVSRALVSSSPDEGTLMLHREDPDRIVPFLRPYHGEVDSSNWYKRESILDYFGERLQREVYNGIGEFHIHDVGDATSPVIKKTVALAVEKDLYVHVHTAAPAIHTIFSYAPTARILWAHAGMTASPQEVGMMMDRYENLWVDISIREQEIAPGGLLDENWRTLFLTHSDRVTIGSDTWINARWEQYETILDFDRDWLAQLPDAVARQIAHENARRLFDSPRSDRRPDQ